MNAVIIILSMTMIKEADKPTYNAEISQLFIVTE